MRKLVLMLTLVFVFLTIPLFGQNVGINSFSLGGGSLFGEEDQTFDTDSLFLSAHLGGLEFPFQEANTGLGLEVSFPKGDIGAVYAVWLENRVKIGKGVFVGSDIQIARTQIATPEAVINGEPLSNFSADVDFRVVVGAYLGKIGPGNLALTIYSLEDTRPIAFEFTYEVF